MKPEPPKQSVPNTKLNIVCFLLPILATFLPAPIEGIAGILGFLGSCIGAFLAAYILIFRPSRKIKQAAWRYLFGFALAVGAFIFVASAINAGQTSPWDQ